MVLTLAFLSSKVDQTYILNNTVSSQNLPVGFTTGKSSIVR